MYTVIPTAKFKRDFKLAEKRGYRIELLLDIIGQLATGKKLDPRHKDHALQGSYKGKRECHITPDWLLIYEIVDEKLILYLSRTGTHADLLE
jgi:mRNA interferase YafQ